MQKVLLLIVIAFLSKLSTSAQVPGTLAALSGHTVKVYYSQGKKERAEQISNRVDKAMQYYQQVLAFQPEVTLLILTERDWPLYAIKELIYGMPHFTADGKLVVAADDNPFWKSFILPMEQLPRNLQQQIKAAYTINNELTMQPFFDLLVLHELGHAFHLAAGLQMQRKWMGELFVNILLHTYIAENEPTYLPALTLFPQMVISAGTANFKYTSLQDVHDKYDEIGQQHPQNYGWYQSRWHAAAARIYETGGNTVGKRLWLALKAGKEVLTDAQLLALLQNSVDKSIAAMIQNWDAETIR